MEVRPDLVPTPWLPAWDGELYAANTGHHRVHDATFLATLPLAVSDRLLDLGCGSGDFTRILADRVPMGHVVGLDPQPSLLAQARSRAGANQSFVDASVQMLGSVFQDADDRFDLVVSRAVLHWVPLADHPGVLAEAFRVLRPGGWLRIEMGGAGNIPRIVPLMDEVSARFGGPRCPWTFPDVGTYLELVEAAGFSVVADGAYVRMLGQRRPFTHESLLGWLHSQAFQAYEVTLPSVTHAPFRAEIEARIDELRRPDGTFDQTYARLDLLARKPPT